MANKLSLLWANRHINKITWPELFDQYVAEALRYDLDHIITKLLDYHTQRDCTCDDTRPDRDCAPGYCKAGCPGWFPCETVKILNGET